MKERLRSLLCDLQIEVRDRVLASRGRGNLDTIAGETAADVSYSIDQVAEKAVVQWFSKNWPSDQPVELVMEGLEGPERFGGDPVWTCIIDPIDGTREIMHDKRSAWVLAGLAPHGGTLKDIEICAMTEIPTTRAWRSDQVSAVRGGGICADTHDIRTGSVGPVKLRPSTADHFRHGFASFVKFFPEGKSLTAQLEERLWDELYGTSRIPVIFEDQYISSGGQIYELLSGRDRMTADLRPLVIRKLGIPDLLYCHPYDLCCGLLLQEAGGVLETPTGEPLDSPLDVTSSIAWVGYANEKLAKLVRPVLTRLVREMLQWDRTTS